MRLKYSLAVAAALTALAAQAQEGGPPGSEAPAEMGGEVETVIVIGTMFRCPDGTMVGDITACRAYASFPNSYFFRATLDTISHMIRDFHKNAPTCGGTVDANCKCGSKKVKVYDDENDKFHCYDEPPAGCPKWDDMFDFDLNVWACRARPLDATATAAADRIKGCFGSGSTVQDYLGKVMAIQWGSCPGGYPGCVACTAVGNFVYIDKGKLNAKANADATVWQWFAEVLNHELRHVHHNTTYGNPCSPWDNRDFWTGEKVPAFVPRNATGEEFHTRMAAAIEYFEELGVRSPYDADYDASKHKQLKTCRLW